MQNTLFAYPYGNGDHVSAKATLQVVFASAAFGEHFTGFHQTRDVWISLKHGPF